MNQILRSLIWQNILVLEKSQEKRLDIALLLYEKGKIGLKRAWKLSGLTVFEFRRILIEKEIDPPYEEKIENQALENALSINLNEHRKKK